MENQIINDLVGGEERFDYEYEDSTASAVNDDVYNFHSDDDDFMTPRKTGKHAAITVLHEEFCFCGVLIFWYRVRQGQNKRKRKNDEWRGKHNGNDIYASSSFHDWDAEQKEEERRWYRHPRTTTNPR